MIYPMKNLIHKIFLAYLIKRNFSLHEVQKFEMSEGYPTVFLNDGTALSAIQSETFPSMENFGIPKGFEAVVYSYITRYKYPHYAPSCEIKTGVFPRTLYPFWIHAQHRNTIYELAKGESKILKQQLQLQENDVVLEAGPFMGFGTIQMGRAISKYGKIASIEADQIAFKVLNKNITQNNIGNVITRNYAIGDADQEGVQFYKSSRPLEMQANSLIADVVGKGRTETVKMYKIETIAQKLNMVPSFIILTINGVEFQALEASKEFIGSIRPLRIITPGWYDDGKGKIGLRIVKLLRSLGFQVYHTKGLHIFAFKD